MKDTPNRRLTERFDLVVPAVITQIGREKNVYSKLCLTRDISSQGAYIGLTDPIPDDDEIEVQLLYTLNNDAGVIEYVQMTATGTVIRREVNGLVVSLEGKSTLKRFHIKHSGYALYSSSAKPKLTICNRRCADGLLHDPPKSFANGFASPSVEAKNIFIQVALQILWIESPLEGSKEDSLHQ